MRLPWVPRASFDLLMHNYNKLHEIVREHETERYDKLLEKYHALKLQGAVSPPPEVQYTPIKSEPFDKLRILIAETAGTDLRKRGLMLRQLRQDRADGVSDQEIRRQIENGIQADGVPA